MLVTQMAVFFVTQITQMAQIPPVTLVSFVKQITQKTQIPLAYYP